MKFKLLILIIVLFLGYIVYEIVCPCPNLKVDCNNLYIEKYSAGPKGWNLCPSTFVLANYGEECVLNDRLIQILYYDYIKKTSKDSVFEELPEIELLTPDIYKLNWHKHYDLLDEHIIASVIPVERTIDINNGIKGMKVAVFIDNSDNSGQEYIVPDNILELIPKYKIKSE